MDNKWFAWRPVKLVTGEWTWLCYVRRVWRSNGLIGPQNGCVWPEYYR
jgi:hypothetical protein